MTTRSTNHYDAVVIGSGLAGLTAALHLQKEGLDTLIIEQKSKPGGLCGTVVLDGYEFVIACNDFGCTLEKEMETLGVKVEFYRPKTLFCFKNATYTLPINGKMLIKLSRYLPDILRIFCYCVIESPLRQEKLSSLEDVACLVKNKNFADLIRVLAYPLGMRPEDISLKMLKEDFSKKYNYGYHQPIIPKGGPARLISHMVARFKQLGGRIQYNITCKDIKPRDRGKVIVTDKGIYNAEYVISSEGRMNDYPPGLKEGLSISAFYLAVRKDFSFPRGVHTLLYLPPNIAEWMGQIDSGEQPKEFGFHIFKSDLPEKDNYYTMNVYFFLPRNKNNVSSLELERLENYIFNTSEKMLPGLARSLLHKRFISVEEFSKINGLSSRIAPFIKAGGFQKLDIYDPQKEVYFIGNSVFPPGEHAGGAILSGILAAKQIIDKHRSILNNLVVS